MTETTTASAVRRVHEDDTSVHRGESWAATSSRFARMSS